MKKLISVLLVMALLLTSGLALAAKEETSSPDKGAKYTMDTKGVVVLQNRLVMRSLYPNALVPLKIR